MAYVIKQISFDDGKTWQEPMSMDDIETVVLESDIRGCKMKPNDLLKELSTIERILSTTIKKEQINERLRI